jgi:hypothetical protein
MFFYAFWIQIVDPIMTAERDAVAHEHLMSVEVKREHLDQQKLELDYRRDMRTLKAHIHRQKLIALFKESNSRRTRSILKRAMQIEMPRILKKIGVPVDEVRRRSKGTFFNRSLDYQRVPHLAKGDNEASLG